MNSMGKSTSRDDDVAARDHWIVLGNRDHGMSFGPMTRIEAEQFAADRPGFMALSWDGACSQIETCAAYGLPFKPRAAT